MAKLRVAMAGAGFASGLHLAGWKRIANAEVVAICDPDEAKAGARAREFGIPHVFDDASVMLDAMRPDAIDIVTSLAAHVALCIAAADRGAHILCQKPLAATLAEAQSLALTIGDRVRLMVHENWRFRAQYRKIKQWLDAGELGEPIVCSLQVRAAGLIADSAGNRPQLVRQAFIATLDRFMIAEVLIHHLDVLRWLLGPLTVVAARIGNACAAVRGETQAVILLEGGGCVATLDGCYLAAGATPTPSDRMELIGTRGTALFEGTNVRLDGERSETVDVDLVTGYGDSYAAAIEHFATALATDQPFETSAQDNLATLALVEAAYVAAPPLVRSHR